MSDENETVRQAKRKVVEAQKELAMAREDLKLANEEARRFVEANRLMPATVVVNEDDGRIDSARYRALEHAIGWASPEATTADIIAIASEFEKYLRGEPNTRP